MADRVDFLFQEWHCLGAAVLLAEIDSAIVARPPEVVIAESTAHCRESGRLTWVVLDWLIEHIGELDMALLLENIKQDGDPGVMGLLCDAAFQRNPDIRFEMIMRQCQGILSQKGKSQTAEPFFHRVAHSPLAARLARESNLAVFGRWNYFSNELRYLRG
jgi:hypothetical protein